MRCPFRPRLANRVATPLEPRLSTELAVLGCLRYTRKNLGGTAWPNYLLADDSWEAPVLLWANSTLGLMSFWWLGSLQQQGRARITISRLPRLLTLDPRELDSAQLAAANSIFDESCSREVEFLPANEAYRDNSRKALDRAVLIDLLGLPDDLLGPLDLLRHQWCAEPTVHGGKSTRPEPP